MANKKYSCISFQQGILGVFFIWATGSTIMAQKEPQYSQYIFNSLVINPAYAGTKDSWSANIYHRKQWMNLIGSPQTQTFSFEGALNEKSGAGFYAANDQLGAQNKISLLGIYSYHIMLAEKAELSFGLSAGFVGNRIDGSKLITSLPNDPAIIAAQQSGWSPDANSGVFYHTERFYVGMSAMNLFSSAFNKGDLMIPAQRNYFFVTGYLFDISDRLKLKPSLLLKEDFSREPLNADINVFALFDDKIWLGLSYRWGSYFLESPLTGKDSHVSSNALVLMTDYYIGNRIRLGYAYDISMTALRRFGSHELSMGYYFSNSSEKVILSPRLF